MRDLADHVLLYTACLPSGYRNTTNFEVILVWVNSDIAYTLYILWERLYVLPVAYEAVQ